MPVSFVIPPRHVPSEAGEKKTCQSWQTLGVIRWEYGDEDNYVLQLLSEMNIKQWDAHTGHLKDLHSAGLSVEKNALDIRPTERDEVWFLMNMSRGPTGPQHTETHTLFKSMTKF